VVEVGEKVIESVIYGAEQEKKAKNFLPNFFLKKSEEIAGIG
jgi:hypothetical protein